MTATVLQYLPGLDGTGQLLYRQQNLFACYDLLCESYPQDRHTTYEELANDAAEHLSDATSGRSGIILAESFGGAVALTLALNHPELVERMLLINTFAWFPTRWQIWLGARLGAYFPNRPSPPWTRGFRSRFFFSPDVSAQDRQTWWRHTGNVPALAMGRRIALIANLDLRPRLREINIPALVLVAPDDRVVPPKAGKELARLLPSACLLQSRVGHAALVHPKINVNALLADSSLWP